jgi:hypothetical protein
MKTNLCLKSATSRLARHNRAAFTLVELMVASGLTVLALMVVMLLSLFSGKSFEALANYTGLDQEGQLALDKLSREVRQAHKVTAVSSNSITLIDKDYKTLQVTFDPASRSLMGTVDGVTTAYLTDCDFLQFTNFMHTPISNTFDAYNPEQVTNTRLIQVTWGCSRSIMGAKANTESIQSAKMYIRNPQ